jgi:hypothetical protein
MDAETFWTQVASYNEATLTIQFVLAAAAVILTVLTFLRPGAKTNILMKTFFAVAFAWNGVVFFLLFVKNPISNFFGAPVFIVLAILFTADIFTKKTEFRFPKAKWKKILTIAWLALVLSYPLIGLPLGHTYPRMLTPVMPCPLTVFALAMAAAALPNVDRILYIVLLPWALAGLPKCLGALDCFEDCVLFAAGVYGLILLVTDWKKIKAARVRPDH